MLTAYQVETIAFQDEERGIFHAYHAPDFYDLVTIAKAERGLTTGSSLFPVIRFTLDEIVSEQAYNEAEAEYSYAADPEKWQAAYDAAPEHYACDVCGEPIT